MKYVSATCASRRTRIACVRGKYPSLTGAVPDLTGNEHGTIVVAQRPPQPPALLAHGKETKSHINGMNCVLSLQNAQTNSQTINCRALNSSFPSVHCTTEFFKKCIPEQLRKRLWSGCGHKKRKMLTCKSPLEWWEQGHEHSGGKLSQT